MQINLGRGLSMAMVFIIAFGSCNRMQKTVLTEDVPNVSQTAMLTLQGGTQAAVSHHLQWQSAML